MNKINEEKIEFRKVRDFSETINDCFTFIKQNFKALLTPLIYICGFFILASIASNVLQQLKMVKFIGLVKTAGQDNTYASEFATYSFGVEYFLVILFTMLSVSAISLVINCFIKLYKENGNTAPRVEQVWELFKRHIVEFFIASILFGILVLLAIFFCLIPGVYLFPLTSIALPVMVFENKGMVTAFSRSSALIKDNWWRTFGLILVAIIITYCCAGILGIPSALMSLGAVFLQNSPKLTLVGSIFSSILSGLAQLFYILPAIVCALWYFSLSEEKEGGGLLERIDNFGNHDGPSTNEWPKEEY
ncbi:hypothetical protein GCM10023231_38060 [Olivibacter ginsenosidimutans]|uniref:Glycerophosphoryl diester phosphodiesterase membrane domain-containing protein n=1 Tax=Olivibacter ginsenosidimutans TaxID=1176537 RepID=A0ABP9C905_9SPHI